MLPTFSPNKHELKDELNRQPQGEDDDLYPVLPGDQVHFKTDCGWLILFIIALTYLCQVVKFAHDHGRDLVTLEEMRQHSGTAARDEQLLIQGADLIVDNWFITVLASFWSMIFGVVYLRFLHVCVDYFMKAIALFLVIVPCLWGVVLIARSAEDKTLGLTDYDTHLGAGFIVLSAVLGLLVYRMHQVIEAASSCIKASTECLIHQQSLLLEPVVVAVIRMVSLAMALSTLAKLVTCINEDEKQETDLPVPLPIKLRMAYVVFMTYWINSLAVALSEYVVTWVASRWYFTPYVEGMKLDVGRKNHCEGYRNVLTKHVGSLVCGSLLVPILYLPRTMLETIDYLTEDPTTGCGKALAKCCCCFKSIFRRCLRPITKNAYIQLAVSSEPFFRSGKHYYQVMKKGSNQHILAATGMQEIFMYGGLLGLTVVSSLATLATVEGLAKTFPEWPTVRTVPVIIIAMLVSFTVVTGFITIFDMVTDTIMYCWMLQEWRYEIGPYKSSTEQIASPIFSWIVGDGHRTEDSRVNYAPTELRKYLNKQRGHADPRSVTMS